MLARNVYTPAVNGKVNTVIVLAGLGAPAGTEILAV